MSGAGKKKSKKLSDSNAENSGKRRRFSHLDTTGIDKHATTHPSIKNITYGSLHCDSSGPNLTSAQVISFNFKTGQNYWRIPIDPIWMTYTVEYPNPAYTAPPADPTAADTRGVDAKRRRNAVVDGDNYYVNPALGGSIFFSKAEIEINGTPLLQEDPFPTLYAALNRTFSTKSTRNRYLRSSDEVISTKDGEAGFKNGQLFVTSSSKTAVDSIKMLRTSMDGFFLLSAPKNLALCGLERIQSNEYTYLPPNTQVKLEI